MGFETERSDEAGRCGLGDWELGSIFWDSKNLCMSVTCKKLFRWKR